MRILIVEDEKSLAEIIKKGLEEEGYAVDVAYDGEEGLFMAENQPADLIILDIMLPVIDGMTILKKIRKAGIKTPVLMLTAKDTVMDKVSGLDTGADDYLTKPFSFEELLARIRALLRRSSDIKASTIEIDDLMINMATHEVMRGGKQIMLSPKEYSLLEYMALNKNKVLSRTDLIEHIYDENSDFDSNVIDVFINRLRNKIDREFDKKLIHTVRGAGYILKE
ncbi:response regulator [Thermodesulfovibrio yellowstonii]|uniref:DNA-binding response regulator n=1 Tax=Thermodesulfovibrio yellowstonii TaxID=28262 RepID=A0A9W6LLH5_9BACT|nr:response regulator transcription factor [Thermodesulfovibrio islandicus]GLI53855.1 DNA-binding response regulator [Thermodesulfovibrio islandicus]